MGRKTVGSKIQPFFKGLGFCLSYSYGPNHWTTGPFEIWTFLSGFLMVFDNTAVICPGFKWVGFQISDPIPNPDHLKVDLFLTITNPD